MTALATIDQLNDRMVGTASDTDRATAILDDVSAAVRAYTGQTITEATTADTLRIIHGRITLPQRPATAITSVTDIDGNAITYEWDGLQRIDVPSGERSERAFAWAPGSNATTAIVTYTHGYAADDDVLDAVAGLVAQIAARAYGTAPEGVGKTQETIGGYSYTIGGAAASGAYGITPQERAMLRKLVGGSRPAGTVFTGGLESLP